VRKILSLDNRTRRPLPTRMEHSRSYLMDECEVMASGRERSPTIIAPALALSSCRRKQASLSANDKSARPSTELFIGFRPSYGRCGFLARVAGQERFSFAGKILARGYLH